MKRNHLRILAVSIFPLLFLLSCHQVQIVPFQAPRNGSSRVDLDARTRSYILGYFQWASHTADCRDGIESIRISKDALDSVVQVLVGAFFSTRHVQVRCVRPHLDVARLEQGRTVRLQGVYFDSGSSRLQKDSYLLLDELVDYMVNHPQVKIKVTGHTDLIGSDQANNRLSLGRAGSVESYLESKGVGGDRVETAGEGSRYPIIRLLDQDSSAINRRVEVTLLSGNQNRPDVIEPVVQKKETKKQSGSKKKAGGETARRDAKGRESTIEMLDGTILKGEVTDQSEDQVIVRVHGQSSVNVIKKDRIKKIYY